MTRIVSTPTVLAGKKRIGRTRISVGLIASYFLQGFGYIEIKRDYPHLTREQIEAALHYVRTHLEEFQLGPQTIQAAR